MAKRKPSKPKAKPAPPTPKTDEEIREEVKRLRDMKPFVRQFSKFGDDNHERIEAQILVLDENYDEDQVYDEWPDDAAQVEIRICAQDAIEWREGKNPDPPSKGWEGLDSRRKQGTSND